MAKFTLPSGRTVETREPTYGDEIHAISEGLASPEAFQFLKFAAIVPELSREEVANLSRSDGRVLAAEVNRIFHGRPEEKEIPFENSSPSGSRARRQKTSTHSNGSSSTAGASA